MTTFIHIIAWSFAILSGLLVILRIISWWSYNMGKHADLKQMLDKMEGKRAIFPITIPGSISIICVAAIIATW